MLFSHYTVKIGHKVLTIKQCMRNLIFRNLTEWFDMYVLVKMPSTRHLDISNHNYFVESVARENKL